MGERKCEAGVGLTRTVMIGSSSGCGNEKPIEILSGARHLPAA